MNKKRPQTPQWQPISMLPTFTEMIDGMLESSVEQLDNMRAVEDKPHVMDDATMKRIIKPYSEQLEDHWLCEEQFKRWKKGKLAEKMGPRFDRLTKQVIKLKETNEEILAIAGRIKHNTIDKIVAMDDAELALAVLSGKIKPPR